jgi:FeS assembly SUF system protein
VTFFVHSFLLQELFMSDPNQSTESLEAIETATAAPADTENEIVEALKTVYDPEIPVNIYELGLIYDIDLQEAGAVHVKMTLTSPACPVAGSLPGEVKKKIEEVSGVTSADVELVWDPVWNPSMMSEAARLQLGMF